MGQCLIDAHDVFTFNNVIYSSLLDNFSVTVYETTGTYLRLNHELGKLAFDERSIVLRSAADNVTCMGFAFIMDHGHLFDNNAFSNAVETKYGRRTIDMQVVARRFIDPDIILIKLGISLFAFSEVISLYTPNIPIVLTNPIHILEIQNKYAEVTWKYLICKYGFCEAVKRFVKLTSWLLASTIVVSHVQSLAQHINDLNSIVEQTELALLLNDVDQITEMN